MLIFSFIIYYPLHVSIITTHHVVIHKYMTFLIYSWITMWWSVMTDIQLHINILLIVVSLISCYANGHILLQCNLCVAHSKPYQVCFHTAMFVKRQKRWPFQMNNGIVSIIYITNVCVGFSGLICTGIYLRHLTVIRVFHHHVINWYKT
jgi:hypothetical protein